MNFNTGTTTTNYSSAKRLTIEDIKKTLQELAEFSPIPKVVASRFCEGHPRMTLSNKVDVTPEFRQEMNDWMLGFFGVEDTIYTIKDPTTGELVIITSQRNIDKVSQVNNSPYFGIREVQTINHPLFT